MTTMISWQTSNEVYWTETSPIAIIPMDTFQVWSRKDRDTPRPQDYDILIYQINVQKLLLTSEKIIEKNDYGIDYKIRIINYLEDGILYYCYSVRIGLIHHYGWYSFNECIDGKMYNRICDKAKQFAFPEGE